MVAAHEFTSAFICLVQFFWDDDEASDEEDEHDKVGGWSSDEEEEEEKEDDVDTDADTYNEDVLVLLQDNVLKDALENDGDDDDLLVLLQDNVLKDALENDGDDDNALENDDALGNNYDFSRRISQSSRRFQACESGANNNDSRTHR